MKTNISWAAGAAALLIAAVVLPRERPAPAQEAASKGRTITTTGTATVTTTPDSARVFFTVRTTGSTAATAREANSAALQRIRAALAALKIPDLKSKTTEFSVEPMLLEPSDGRRAPKVVGYKALHGFTALAQMKDREQLAEAAQRVVDAGVGNGALVQRVQFFREDEADVRRQALAQAVQDGQENADALARGARSSVKEVIQIEDQPTYELASLGNTSQAAMRTGGGNGVSLQAGELKVTCTVRVTCRF